MKLPLWVGPFICWFSLVCPPQGFRFRGLPQVYLEVLPGIEPEDLLCAKQSKLAQRVVALPPLIGGRLNSVSAPHWKPTTFLAQDFSEPPTWLPKASIKKHCPWYLISSVCESTLTYVVLSPKIPANEFLCIGFRVAEIFRVGMASPGTFTVYEYHTPGKESLPASFHLLFLTASKARALPCRLFCGWLVVSIGTPVVHKPHIRWLSHFDHCCPQGLIGV